jgi:predicted  nucleic acid-binding Zn-ribbon protein
MTALLNRVAELEDQRESHDSEIALLHSRLANETSSREDLLRRVLALEATIAAAATIFSQ